MYSYGSPHMAAQKQDDQLEHTFSSYVRIQDVVLKTYLGRWTIGRSGERGSGISVLPTRYDDDDIYIYIYMYVWEREREMSNISYCIYWSNEWLHEMNNLIFSHIRCFYHILHSMNNSWLLTILAYKDTYLYFQNNCNTIKINTIL